MVRCEMGEDGGLCKRLQQEKTCKEPLYREPEMYRQMK